jgi:nicotinamidase-related amidase
MKSLNMRRLLAVALLLATVPAAAAEAYKQCRADTVLVVIDLQNGFIRSATKDVVPKIVDLVSTWTHAGGEVVFTRFRNEPGSQYVRLMGWSRLEGSPDTDLVPEIQPLAKTIIDKYFYSAFTAEAFRDLAKRHGWHQFAIAGIATDSCVLKTAMDTFELGYTPIVLSDSCASHGGAENHDAALRILRRNIGPRQVVETSAFLEQNCSR